MTALPIFEAQFGWLITTAASIGVGNDLLITVTLVLVLQKQRGEVQARYDSLPLFISTPSVDHYDHLKNYTPSRPFDRLDDGFVNSLSTACFCSP